MWLVKQLEEDELWICLHSAQQRFKQHTPISCSAAPASLLPSAATARLLLERGAAPLRICCVSDPSGRLSGTSLKRLAVGSWWKWRILSLHGCCVPSPGHSLGGCAEGWGAAPSWAPACFPAMHTISWSLVHFLTGARGTLVGQAQQSLCCLVVPVPWVNSRINLQSCQSRASTGTGVPKKDGCRERCRCTVLPWNTQLEKILLGCA